MTIILLKNKKKKQMIKTNAKKDTCPLNKAMLKIVSFIFFIDSLISTLFENVQFILESTEKGERK